jgi:hypothetical protein
MEPRHRAEEIHPRNVLCCREHSRQSIDEADRDIVAIDIVALLSLAVWFGNRCGRGSIGIKQRRGKSCRIGRLLAVILLAMSMGCAGFSGLVTVRVAIEDRSCGGGLRLEDGPVRDIAVPFNKRRDGSVSANYNVEQFPNRVGDRAVMAVDQQKLALVIPLVSMAGEMDLADTLQRKIA